MREEDVQEGGREREGERVLYDWATRLLAIDR